VRQHRGSSWVIAIGWLMLYTHTVMKLLDRASWELGIQRYEGKCECQMFSSSENTNHLLSMTGFKEHLANPAEVAADTFVILGVCAAAIAQALFNGLKGTGRKRHCRMGLCQCANVLKCLQLSRWTAKIRRVGLPKAKRGEIRNMIDLRRVNTLHGAALLNVAMFAAAIAILIGLWTSPGFAFGGCVQASPESPSLVLGLIGAGVAALPLLRAWFKAGSDR
jgi:hypothetical protein